jgi:hypothetical protein
MTSDFASKIGSFLSGAAKVLTAGVGAAAAGVGAITKMAVDEVADYQQLTGGVETLFKDGASALMGYADIAYQTAGLSANEYMETATSFAATLLQSLEGDTAAAVEYANTAITDMSDNANKMGTDISMIQNAYNGFAKGNYTMLDNLKLGYGGTAREMARLVNESGVLSQAMLINLDDSRNLGAALQEVGFDKIIEAIHRVQENMGITGTTAAEAAETISGAVASMQSAWSNWLTGLGTEGADVSALTDNLVNSALTVASNLKPVIEQIGESLVGVLADVTGIDLAPALEKINAFKDGALGMIKAVVDGFNEGGISGAIEGALSKFEDLTGVDLTPLKNNVVGMVEGLKSAFDELKRAFDEDGPMGVVDLLVGKFEDLTGIDLSPIVSGVQGFFQNFTESTAGISERISTALGDFFGMFGDDAGGWTTTFNNVVVDVGNLFTSLGTITGDALSLLADGFETLLNTLTANGISDKLKDLVTEISKLFHLFEGTEENSEGALDILKKLFEFLGSVAGEYITGVIDTLTFFIEEINLTVEAAKELLNLDFSGFFDTIVEQVEDAVDWFRDLWDMVVGAGQALANFSELDWFGDNDEKKDEFDRENGEGAFASMQKETDDALRSGVKTVDVASSTLSGKLDPLLVDIANQNGYGQAQNPVNINVNVDGKKVAEAVYDPLQDVAKQKGQTGKLTPVTR